MHQRREGKRNRNKFRRVNLEGITQTFEVCFLESEKAKHVIILAALTELEEHKLLEILNKYKEAIAWSIEDLK